MGGEGGLEVAPLTSLRCLGVFDRLSLSLSSSQVFLNKKAKTSLTEHILHNLCIVNSEQCVILPPLLNRAHKVIIYGRVGQPSHRAIYLALIYSQKSITIKEN